MPGQNAAFYMPRPIPTKDVATIMQNWASLIYMHFKKWDLCRRVIVEAGKSLQDAHSRLSIR